VHVVTGKEIANFGLHDSFLTKNKLIRGSGSSACSSTTPKGAGRKRKANVWKEIG
jgi:hypothetical protein